MRGHTHCAVADIHVKGPIQWTARLPISERTQWKSCGRNSRHSLPTESTSAAINGRESALMLLKGQLGPKRSASFVRSRIAGVLGTLPRKGKRFMMHSRGLGTSVAKTRARSPSLWRSLRDLSRIPQKTTSNLSMSLQKHMTRQEAMFHGRTSTLRHPTANKALESLVSTNQLNVKVEGWVQRPEVPEACGQEGENEREEWEGS